MKITTIQLEEINSTNDFLRHYPDPEKNEIVVAYADFQTAGRGQGQNRWESERGKNLLFSILTAPVWMPLQKQFLLSMAGALALKDALDKYTEGITMKWPNDIYWNDRKISGTLIETALSGKSISRCIFGIGLNVNQQVFRSDAPNPVSLWQILGHETDRSKLLEEILQTFRKYLEMLKENRYDEIRELYHTYLYRREGYHEFIDHRGGFMARIIEVKDNGHLVIEDQNGNRYEYELKEIQHGKI